MLVAVVATLLISHGAFAQTAYVLINGLIPLDMTTYVTGDPIYFNPPGGGVAAVASPDGSKIYSITTGNPGHLAVVDIAARKVITAPQINGAPQGLAASPDGSKVYVTSSVPGLAATVFSTATNTATNTIPATDSSTFGVVVSPDGNTIYVSGSDKATGNPVLYIASTATNAVTSSITLDSNGSSDVVSNIVISPDGSTLYIGVANSNGLTVLAVSVPTKKISPITNIGCGGNIAWMALAPDGSRLYVAGTQNCTAVAVIDTAANLVISFIPEIDNYGANALAITPDGTRLVIVSGRFIVWPLDPNVQGTVQPYLDDTGPVIFAPPTVQSAPKSKHTCNGIYSGTCKGDIHVLPGQSCVFLDGGLITGEVHVEGNFILTGAVVDGDVEVGPAGSFKIGASATIGGSLSIENTAPSASVNKICGTTVAGDAHFDNNGSSLQIGSANPLLCIGNRFGGHVDIDTNTGPTLVFNNSTTHSMFVSGNSGPLDVVNNVVGGSLKCQANINLIMGGGNKAHNTNFGQCN
jgi:DNA-binding beta-propeller fold protein YncE